MFSRRYQLQQSQLGWNTSPEIKAQEIPDVFGVKAVVVASTHHQEGIQHSTDRLVYPYSASVQRILLVEHHRTALSGLNHPIKRSESIQGILRSNSGLSTADDDGNHTCGLFQQLADEQRSEDRPCTTRSREQDDAKVQRPVFQKDLTHGSRDFRVIFTTNLTGTIFTIDQEKVLVINAIAEITATGIQTNDVRDTTTSELFSIVFELIGYTNTTATTRINTYVFLESGNRSSSCSNSWLFRGHSNFLTLVER